jgi:hypothetical protein
MPGHTRPYQLSSYFTGESDMKYMTQKAFIETLSEDDGRLDDCGLPVNFRATHNSKPIAHDGTTFSSIKEARAFYKQVILDLKNEEQS